MNRTILNLKIILSIFASISTQFIYSQVSVSPYSKYGLGTMNQQGDARSFAMGDAGIALPSTYNINTLNTASYSTFDSLTFYINFNISGTYTRYISDEQSENQFNSGFNGLTFGFKAQKWWGIGFGLSSLSNIDYNIGTTNIIDGSTIPYNINYTGKGGISSIFWGNAIKLSRNLSVGVNTTFLWGKIEHSEISDFSSIGSNTISNDEVYYINKFMFDYSLFYCSNIKNNTLSIGLNYSNKATLFTSLEHNVTLSNGNELLNESLNTSNLVLPQKLGIGIGFNIRNQLTIAADYKFENWSDVQNSISDGEVNDANNYNLGFEYSLSRYQYKNIFRRMKYRCGIFVNDSYLKQNNFDIVSKGFSLGLQIPFRSKFSSINISYQYNELGSSNGDLIKEVQNNFKIGFTFGEDWFVKPHFN